MRDEDTPNEARLRDLLNEALDRAEQAEAKAGTIFGEISRRAAEADAKLELMWADFARKIPSMEQIRSWADAPSNTASAEPKPDTTRTFIAGLEDLIIQYGDSIPKKTTEKHNGGVSGRPPYVGGDDDEITHWQGWCQCGWKSVETKYSSVAYLDVIRHLNEALSK